MIFDSHAHYDDERFNEDRDMVLKEIRENGVMGVINCGSDLRGLEMSVKLSEEYDFIYAAAGIHPGNADEFTDQVKERICDLARDNKIVAVGEIGLDYYWEENPSKEVQKEVFRNQMDIARKFKLPVIIHDRDAHGDTLEILKEFPEVNGVVHCFSGSVEFAKECIKLGYYIGVTGVVTFKNSRVIREVIKAIPLNRLLLETDCPYMAPTPFRGKRNQSDYISYIIDEIAAILNIEKEDLEKNSILNTKNLFKISK
ncbi:MAG: TatD family hydrolase [Clostridium sp.]|uniref:TatD family hydrolase n=1 Tax=Clostridium sp. TaxID=1506 RepID=UPI003067E63E